MNEPCPNPHCMCDTCRCQRPCTCGLHLIATTYNEWWDLITEELVVTDERRYAVVDGAPPSPPDPGPTHPGGHGPAGGSVTLGEPAELLAESIDPDRYRPAVEQRAAAIGHHSHGAHRSVRTDQHQGHNIEIVTRYEITIDGEPLQAEFMVNNDGSVHYHGLPTYAAPSAVDLVRNIIDSFPYDFPPLDSEDGEGEA